MRVLYKDEYVRNLFEDLRDHKSIKKKLQKVISFEYLRSIKMKFDQLLASPNFYFVIYQRIGKCEALVGDMKGKYSIHISANYRIIISPNSLSLEINDLKLCEEFYIEGVVDYHGNKQNWIIP